MVLPALLIQAQDIAQIKKGVVKITAQVEGKNTIDSGIIVKLEEDHVYIVTASHVVEGDQQPSVMFFSAPHRPFLARVLGLEGGNPAGLAALLIEGKLPPDLQVLNLDQTTSIGGGEAITLIGFPQMEGSLWTVTTGTLSGRRGSALSFAGVADDGNSGGPVLFQGKVVGIVTQVGAKFNSAAPAMLARFALEGWGGAPLRRSENSTARRSEKGLQANSRSTSDAATSGDWKLPGPRLLQHRWHGRLASDLSATWRDRQWLLCQQPGRFRCSARPRARYGVRGAHRLSGFSRRALRFFL
ncbi:MAG: serine protease [Nitrospirota bacterium]